jgi:hypothetical protein
MSAPLSSESRIEAVALQLTQTMGLFEQEPSEEMIRIWMNELAASSFSTDESKEIVRQAAIFQKAAPSENNSTTTPQSMSLWNQFTSFSERVMWSDIQSAKDDIERLALLQKVDHIDDILTDWKDVRQLLQHGLEQQEQAYLDLHNKWFGHCQATAEYQTIRTDLCSNILREARRRFGTTTYMLALTMHNSFSSEEEIVFKFLHTWKTMWIKIITSGGYNEEGVDAMVLQALVLMRNLSADGCSNNNQDALLVLLPAHFLAMADLHADWLRCWLEETPIHRILLVLTQSRFLPDLFQRCQNNKDNSSSSFQAGPVEARTIVVVNAGDETNLQKLQAVLHTQSLAMLSSLLIHLRVRMFPWNQLETEITPLPKNSVLQETAKADNNYQLSSPVPYSEHHLLVVATALLTCTTSEQLVQDKWLVGQCGLAIESLSSVCANDEQTYSKLREMVANCKEGSLLL